MEGAVANPGSRLQRSGEDMSKLATFIIVGTLGAIAVGAVFIATWEIPPPTAKVERVIPDGRFPR